MRWIFFLLVTALHAHFSQTLSHPVPPSSQEYTWEETTTNPFDELIVSWNGFRPHRGKWSFWVSLRKGQEWSPWLLYAKWGADSQKTCKSTSPLIETYQDGIYPLEGACNAFRIKVIASKKADLSNLQTLFATTSSLKNYSLILPENLPSILLENVPLQSQMVLDHPRAKDLCSPTSLTTAINYLLKKQTVDPTYFAEKIRDRKFDIYGNWILNTAQGFCELQGAYPCHVERLNNFSELHKHLMENLPVVVSIRGTLPGGAKPYTAGHLICVIGYDAETEQVHCIDSGFPTSEQTRISYPLPNFLKAWGERHNIAYVFH